MGLKFCVCNKLPDGPQALSSKEPQYHSWELNVMGATPSVKEHQARSGPLLLCIKPPPSPEQSDLLPSYYSSGLIWLSSVGLSGHPSCSCSQIFIGAVWFSVWNVQEGSLMWLAADPRCC